MALTTIKSQIRQIRRSLRLRLHLQVLDQGLPSLRPNPPQLPLRLQAPRLPQHHHYLFHSLLHHRTTGILQTNENLPVPWLRISHYSRKFRMEFKPYIAFLLLLSQSATYWHQERETAILNLVYLRNTVNNIFSSKNQLTISSNSASSSLSCSISRAQLCRSDHLARF